MKVKVIEPRAGHADERYNLEDFSLQPGQVIDIDDTLAAAWIESGTVAAAEEDEPEEDKPEEEEPEEDKPEEEEPEEEKPEDDAQRPARRAKKAPQHTHGHAK